MQIRLFMQMRFMQMRGPPGETHGLSVQISANGEAFNSYLITERKLRYIMYLIRHNVRKIKRKFAHNT